MVREDALYDVSQNLLRLNLWPNIQILGSKVTADGHCGNEIKRHLFLGRKVRTNLDSILQTLLCQQRSI